MKKILIIFIGSMLVINLPNAAPAKDPTAQDYLNKASVQYMSGNLPEALKLLDAGLKLDPKYQPALQLKQVVLTENESVKSMADQKLAAGRRLLDQGEYARAIEYFNDVLIVSPNNKNAADSLAQAEKKINEKKAADVLGWRLFVGSLAVGLTVLFILIWLIRVPLADALSRRSFYSRNVAHCFNCGAKISSNTDICPNCGAWIGSKLRVEISKEQKLWYQKTGWRKNPFTLDIHPELFTGYRDEVKQILERVASKSGHILITGPLGVGKTTLLRWLSNYLRLEAYPIYIPRPPQSVSQVIKAIFTTLNVNSTEYDIYNLDLLRKKLGKSLVLLLDEAHEFTVEFERPLRTLGDLDEVKLVMAGLPETADKFKNEIQPLYERIVLNISLERLSFEDMKALIIIRIENANGKGIHPFTVAGLEKIYELSGGIPRAAIKYCDAAVNRAITAGEDKITPEIVESAKTVVKSPVAK